MLAELISQSWANLKRQRTRSVLTMLGIVIGVGAVSRFALLTLLINGFVAAMVLIPPALFGLWHHPSCHR